MDNTLRYERGNCGSIPYGGTKFCKCQQENVMLIRLLRRAEVVEGKRVQLPAARKDGSKQVAKLD